MFSDNARWGPHDDYKIIEEHWLEEGKASLDLGSVISVYKNLKDNYEFRMKYDESDRFVRQMEIGRRYRQVFSRSGFVIKRNAWFRRHFSLYGLYYHLSRYQLDLFRPILFGILIILFTTLFFVTQSNTALTPSFNSFKNNNTFSAFVDMRQVGNDTHWLKAFERSIGDFIPITITSLNSNVKTSMIDTVIKIVGAGIAIGLIMAILKRNFKRKFSG